jgi:hypothetical protein
MNVQRWIALGMLVLTAVCVGTSNVWMASLMQDDDETTPTPDLTGTAQVLEAESGVEVVAVTGTVTATLNPAVEAILADLGQDAAVSNQPFVILTGEFTTIDSLHQGTGSVSIYQVGDRRYVLRLDPFTVTNGPDLHVLLSTQPVPRTSTDVLNGHMDLGALASNSVAQNFEIPSGTFLDIYKSVVIYSRSLNIVYTTAELNAVRGGNNP